MARYGKLKINETLMLLKPDITIGDNGNWFIDGEDTGKPSVGEGGSGGLTAEEVEEIVNGKGYASENYVDSEINSLAQEFNVKIPTKTSQLTNDSGYIKGYTETDPTVPAWAKAPNKPQYTASEVGALPSSTVLLALGENTGTAYDGAKGAALYAAVTELSGIADQAVQVVGNHEERISTLEQGGGGKLYSHSIGFGYEYDGMTESLTLNLLSTKETLEFEHTFLGLCGLLMNYGYIIPTVKGSGTALYRVSNVTKSAGGRIDFESYEGNYTFWAIGSDSTFQFGYINVNTVEL